MPDDRLPFERPWAVGQGYSSAESAGPASRVPASEAAKPVSPSGVSAAEAAARALADDLRSASGGEGDSPPDESEPQDQPGRPPAEQPGGPSQDQPGVPADVVAGDAGDAVADADALVAEAEAAISQDLSTLSAERDEYLDSLRRLQADFENYKKRMMKQQTTTLERAGEDIVVKLLPVLDTADLARRHGAAEGVEQVASALFDVLAKEGLERIDPGGSAFDPNEHEAVAHEEGDGQPEVVDVMRAGYRWRGRLLRAALVTVKG